MRVLALLFRKILLEQRATLMFCHALAALFVGLGSYLFVTFGEMNVEVMTRLSPELISSMFGGLLAGLTPLDQWLVTLFVHPLVMTMFSVLLVAVAARTLAGEIDRGTIDVLLACPVARWQLVAALVLYVLVVLTTMTLVVWTCMHVGLGIAELDPPDPVAPYRWVLLNLWLLFFAVGGVVTFFSATAREQGVAVARSLGFLVVSFFVHLIAGLWSRAEPLDPLSVFHWYQPQPILEAGRAETAHLVVLSLVGIVFFGLSFWWFRRRDIATV